MRPPKRTLDAYSTYTTMILLVCKYAFDAHALAAPTGSTSELVQGHDGVGDISHSKNTVKSGDGGVQPLSPADLLALLSIRSSLTVYPVNGTFASWYKVAPTADGGSALAIDPCTQWEGVGCEGGQVVSLILRNMHLRGTLPKFREGDLRGLETLDMSHNQIKGSIDASLANLISLRHFRMNLNLLTGTIPSELGKLTNLEMLELDGGYNDEQRVHSDDPNKDYYGAPGTHYGNQLTGTIPTTFGFLRNLQLLNLHRNMLEGGIPWELNKMESVAEIDLSGNRLTGTLPDLHHLQKLRVLLVDDQRLSGTFPPGLAKAPSLEVLVVEDNQLTGTLPPHMPPRATFIDIHSNLLSGTIPDAWAEDSPRLNVLMLHDNNIHGTIPAALARLPHLHTVSFAVNIGMCGIDPGLQTPNATFLEQECDKVLEPCDLWPETRGTGIHQECGAWSQEAATRGTAGVSDKLSPHSQQICSAPGEQCGGIDYAKGGSWTGPTCCAHGAECVRMGQRFSRCSAAREDEGTTRSSLYNQVESGSGDGSGGACASGWDQCGGASWAGPTCCEPELECVSLDASYSQCLPVSRKCSAQWVACGGEYWNGPSCCQDGLVCVEVDRYFSQCQPA